MSSGRGQLDMLNGDQKLIQFRIGFWHEIDEPYNPKCPAINSDLRRGCIPPGASEKICRDPPRTAAKEAAGAAGQNELLRIALEELPSPISRTGGFPNNRLYSRLNCEELS